MRVPLPCLGAGLLMPIAAAQGTYVNYEDPQVKPIAVATLGVEGNTQPYVLVCNTPDDRIEIYRAQLPLAAPLFRVPVGLSPVTVRWHQGHNRFYTCNSLGDSVTVVRIDLQNGDPTQLAPVVERTVAVGDEPNDIAFASDGSSCLIALGGRGKLSNRSLPSLAELAPAATVVAPPQPNSLITDAIKVPRSVLFAGNDRIVLNGQGGNGGSPNNVPDGDYDFDLHFDRTSGQSSVQFKVGGLGTTHFAMASHAGSGRLFVVGQAAQNLVGLGESALEALPGGFVQSWLWVLDTAQAVPAIVPEAAAGVPSTVSMPSIHLNRNYATPAIPGTSLSPVSKALALAQPTDLELIADATTVQAVVIPAFGSDRVAILTPSTVAGGWQIQRVDMPLAVPSGAYGRSGPRGVAWSPATIDPQAPPGTPAGVVFVANRLDNSLAAINPWTASLVGQRALANDPTPTVVRAGREFLYSADLSGNGFGSCASCHIDGRTDALGWDLGDFSNQQIPAGFVDNADPDLATTLTHFAGQKGVMITQTLQGLVNSVVEPLEMQDHFSNRPYHWRGDRASFEAFNQAFAGLLGLPPLGPTNPNGIPDADMTAFRAFIDTIHHPPNPEQSIHRTYVDDATAEAARGLRLFHEIPLLATGQNRSCVHCHSLPEGSSNTASLQLNNHAIESAALRNLFLREMRFVTGFGLVGPNSNWTRSGTFGLTHDGFNTPVNRRSINDFLGSFTNDLNGVLGSTQEPAARRAIVAFVRRFDTGSAPIIGLARTLNGSASDATWLQDAEAQVAEGNAGLVVRVHTNTTWQGYWFDVTTAPPSYRLEGTNTLKTRADLAALTTTATVIAQATPARSERRFASQTGNPTLLTGPKPGGVRLLAMAPNTAFVDVPTFAANVEPLFGAGQQVPPSMRIMQYLSAQLAPHGFGVPVVPTHQPPRRFRVAGDGILPGARLEIGMRKLVGGAVTTINSTFELVPTTRMTAAGQRIWETVEELDPLQTMAWLAGGYWAEGVSEVLAGTTPPPVPLAPVLRNSYRVRVVNEDGQVSRTTNAALTIGNTR